MNFLGGAIRRRTEDREQGPAEGTRDARQRWLLAVCCVAQFMVILDLTIVNVALPSIQGSLGFSSANLQWVVIAYAIVFAGFLMLGGRAADQLGQRRTLAAGLVLFAIASLAGGMSASQGMLVIARAVQGLSGALMAAGSLAAITSSFPPGPARHRAIGLWGAMNGVGGAAGALFGGIITYEIGWRWVLLINPPIGIVAAVIAILVIADRPTKVGARFDLLGALVLTAGLMLTAYGIVNASTYGLTTALAFGPIIGGIVLTGLFPVVEARAKDPLVPLKEVTGAFRSANLVVLVFSASLFGMWYISSLYMQQVLGLTPLNAGLAFFPMALVLMLSASQAGRLVGKFGVRPVLGGGLVMLGAGLLLLARIGPSGSAVGFVILPGLLVTAGIGLSVVPSTIAATQLAGHQQAGLASGLVNTSRQVGGALGLAVLASVATWYSSRQIGRNVPTPVALTQGFRVSFLIAAGLALLAAVGTFTLLPPGAGPGKSAWVRLRLPAAVLVVIAAFVGIDFGFAGGSGAPIGAFTTKGAYSFVSAPGLHPPKIHADMKGSKSELAPGDILLSNFYDLGKPPIVGQSGPLMIGNDMQPVWFRPVPKNVVASDLAEQTYEGKPALSWWQGVVTRTGATNSGEFVIVNQHYQTIATLKGADGWIPTMHTLVIKGHDAWVTANKDMPMNLARYGGSVDGAITDSAVQEYDLRSGKLLHTWDALKHIPVTDSYANPPSNGFPWDVYHVNSIDVVGPNTLLVSMRNTWAAYLINTKTGAIQWTLGGKHSTFKFGKGASFEWQHDVSMLPGNRISMFDDACCQIVGSDTFLPPNGTSRGLTLHLNRASGTASLESQVKHDGVEAAYMGSDEHLPNGNEFVGWGSTPYFSEYSKSGKLLMDGILPGSNQSYRAIQISHWTGLPLTPPSGAARRHGSSATVYASWNGATQVASWRVLAGPDASHLAAVKTTAKSGFETAIPVGKSYQDFRLQALDAKGHVIGTSKVFPAT
ncbi:MAG: MFS transporter [Nocardiopsaceae bacterium]|nr:MFS transporter [Nocardiopsaceae bacterium]